MERFKGFFGHSKDKEPSFNIVITPEASACLKNLITLPNPNSAEFPFFGLGKDGVVDTILTADERLFRSGAGIWVAEDGSRHSGLNSKELENLYGKLYSLSRNQDFLILGHSHPIHNKNFEKIIQLSKSDVVAIKWSSNNYPSLLPEYSAIVAGTDRSEPRLRIYRNSDVIEMQSLSGINRLPKVTFNL